jgi:hypothetical protein
MGVTKKKWDSFKLQTFFIKNLKNFSLNYKFIKYWNYIETIII